MSEKRACPLCGEPLEDPPAIHDLAKCENTELIKGRATIKKLTTSLYDWKYGEGGWFHLRDIIGRLSWEHNNCPYERKAMPEQIEVWVKGKLVGAVLSTEAEAAVRRLMGIPNKPSSDVKKDDRVIPGTDPIL